MARPLRDPIASSIEGLSQAITADRPQWQQNVAQTTERLTGGIADAVSERVTPTLTDAIRRTVSTSRSDQNINVTTDAGTWQQSGNITPTSTFRRFDGDVPDLNNPPRFTDQARRPIHDDIEDFTEEEIRHLETVGQRARESAEEARRIVEDISVTGSAAGRIPVAPQTQTSGQQPPPPRDPPGSNGPPIYVNPSTADRAAQHAEEARRIVADIAGAGGGGRIPPNPPGGNDPPEPPDEPEDNDSILNRLLEFFQRMFGVRPDIANRNFLDTLANNLTSILGGVIPQPGPDGQRPSAVSTLMDTFADYFGVPRETEQATLDAQETLRRSIDRLTDATNNAAGGTPAQPQGRFARFRSFFRRGRTRRGGIATATRLASYMRPVLRGIANTVPTRWRNAASQMGVNAMTAVGGRFGIPAATAARFGAALGPAAIGVGLLAYGLPLIGSAIKATISGLNKLAASALQTTFALANYSGLLAHANAQLEFNREMRKFDMANRMGGFGADRLAQLNRLENAMQPWQVMAGNAGNMWGTFIDSALATLLESINGLIAVGMDLQAAVLEWVPGDQGEDNLRKAAEKLRNPAADMPAAWAGREQLFGQNAVDMIDLGKRLQGPRRPVNGGN